MRPDHECKLRVERQQIANLFVHRLADRGALSTTRHWNAGVRRTSGGSPLVPITSAWWRLESSLLIDASLSFARKLPAFTRHLNGRTPGRRRGYLTRPEKTRVLFKKPSPANPQTKRKPAAGSGIGS